MTSRYICLLLVLQSLQSTTFSSPAQNANSISILDNGTTRAAILWRKLIDRDPLLASQASMYWRIAAMSNPESASHEALHARKITASDPEVMFTKSLLYRNKRSLSAEFNQLALDYWQKFAANDPEVAARASMYWILNPDANMYW